MTGRVTMTTFRKSALLIALATTGPGYAQDAAPTPQQSQPLSVPPARP